MKMNKMANIGLIFGILLILGFSIVPVSASDDAFWTPSAPVAGDGTSWLIPASQDQLIEWGQLISKQATPYYIPSTMPTAFPTLSPTSGGVVPGQNTGVSLTELNLQGKYVRITNTGTTPVVMTGWKITNSQGNALNFIDYPLGGGSTFTYVLNPYSTLTVYFGREGIVSANELFYPYGVDFWNPQGDTASLYNPQGQLVGRITISATPDYIPSTIPTVYPTLSPTTGGVVPGQNTGVSLTELNLPGKYVRITNTGSTPVVMTGWKITNSQGSSLNFIDFPLGGGTTFTYVLNPYSTLTVYFGKEGMVSANELYYPYGVDFWNQQGDTASLWNPQGQLAGRISA